MNIYTDCWRHRRLPQCRSSASSVASSPVSFSPARRRLLSPTRSRGRRFTTLLTAQHRRAIPPSTPRRWSSRQIRPLPRLRARPAICRVHRHRRTFVLDKYRRQIPYFLRGAGGTYAGAQTLTITDKSAGSKIYYTLDGSTPTTNSAVYTGPLTIQVSETVTAFATAPTLFSSSVVSQAYTIQPVYAINFSQGFSLAQGRD